ncbi:ABC transporter permease [Salinicoccus sesuvii]|uniref:ABC transporter permease n=1 Tax=Salinicoccus sesuvii TaxID=868281 RepID=A0ABV7N363_9STAP
MNYKLKYLFRHFFKQTGYFSRHNLTPLLIYTIGLIFLVLSMSTMEESGVIGYLYTLTGVMATVWLFSMVVLNRNSTFYKDSVLKVNYIPLYVRILPTTIFQTFIFLVFTVLYSAFTTLIVQDWLINIFILLYYVLLGVVLIIPFTLLYLSVEVRRIHTVNTLVFVVLVITVPIIYLPENIEPWLQNLLSLNPFYYVINGLQSNAVHIGWNINRLPYDILFFSQVILLYLWMFEYYSKIKFTLYRYLKKRPGE